MAIVLALYLPLVWVPGTAGAAPWALIGVAAAVPFVCGSWLERRAP